MERRLAGRYGAGYGGMRGSATPPSAGHEARRDLIGEHADKHDDQRHDRADQLGKRPDTGDQLRATAPVPYAPKKVRRPARSVLRLQAPG